MKLMLLTGANGQIGSYLAKSYLEEGYNLALLYHKRDDRLSCFRDLPNCYLDAVDLTDYQSVSNAIANISAHFKQSPSVLLHSAALRSYDALPLAESEASTFCEVINNNLMSAYNILRAVLPGMLAQNHGRVVLFGSNVSRTGLKQGSAYAASKAAIINLMQSVSQETAGTGVLINAISPAPVDTNLEEDYYGEYLEFRRKYFADYLSANTGSKLISKSEIKQVIDLLINPNIHSICGEEIFLSGGSKNK